MQDPHEASSQIRQIEHPVVEHIQLIPKEAGGAMREEADPQHSIPAQRPDVQRPDDLPPKLDRGMGYKSIPGGGLPLARTQVEYNFYTPAWKNSIFKCRILIRFI